MKTSVWCKHPMNTDERAAKESELMAFIETESSRLRMNVPSPAVMQETMEFLAGVDPNWTAQTTPDEFARILKQRYPELRFEWTDATDPEASGDEPATEKQIAYLKVLEVPVPEYMGMREASDLIDKHRLRASPAQRRRLDFYKLSYDPEITREQANEMIDRYKAEHPESETAYQEWKSGQSPA
jgi:hypothetical protein